MDFRMMYYRMLEAVTNLFSSIRLPKVVMLRSTNTHTFIVETESTHVRYQIDEIDRNKKVVYSFAVRLSPEQVRRLIAYETASLQLIELKTNNTSH